MTFALPSSCPQFLGPGPAALCAISIEPQPSRRQQNLFPKIDTIPHRSWAETTGHFAEE